MPCDKGLWTSEKEKPTLSAENSRWNGILEVQKKIVVMEPSLRVVTNLFLLVEED
jgi:hypothetical protein